MNGRGLLSDARPYQVRAHYPPTCRIVPTPVEVGTKLGQASASPRCTIQSMTTTSFQATTEKLTDVFISRIPYEKSTLWSTILYMYVLSFSITTHSNTNDTVLLVVFQFQSMFLLHVVHFYRIYYPSNDK